VIHKVDILILVLDDGFFRKLLHRLSLLCWSICRFLTIHWLCLVGQIEKNARLLLTDFLFSELEGGGVLIPAGDKVLDRLDETF
jgi:hypothetical protein